MNDFDLVVVGAGIVGVSSALWAQERGLKTLLCDPNLPGSGASYGNACTLAIYACLPVNSPSVITGLPYLLASADSPLSINYWHAITHPRWMLSFLNNCRAPKVEHIAASLAGLLSHADAGINPLIASAVMTVATGKVAGVDASGALVLAGGTDLISLMKDYVYSPKRVVNIKNIRELGGITQSKGGLRIGASVTVSSFQTPKVVSPNLMVIVEGSWRPSTAR